MAIFKKHSYFHHPKNFSYSAFLFSWCVNLALLVVLAKMRKEEVAAVSSYAVALTLSAIYDARKLRSECIPAALHSSDVGADDCFRDCFVWQNHRTFVFFGAPISQKRLATSRACSASLGA